MWQDLRQAVRVLRKHPSFVYISALVLALGIGLNAAIFSIVYTLLFKSLPVRSPENLVSIYQVFPRQPDRPAVLNRGQFEFLRTHNEAFTDLTAHSALAYTLRADDETDIINAELVLSNYFAVLGIQPLLGRTLLPSEDEVSNPDRAVVISYTLWKRRFRSDPEIVGTQIRLALSDQRDVLGTIVGVMGPDFVGVSAPWKPTQLWITMAQGRNRPERYFAAAAIGRLKPGINVEQARTIISAQGRQFSASQSSGRAEFAPRFIAYRASDVRVPSDPSAAVIPTRLAAAMMIVVAVVLLVAAANVAGILMARGVGRSGEISVRRVLGAGPLRIVRQLLAESLLLSLAGGVLGIVLASWLLSVFRALTPMQYAIDVDVDLRVVLFTAAICVLAGVVIAILPARQAATLDVLPWLTGSGAMQIRPLRHRLRHSVTLPQVASSLVLLLVAGVYVRALVQTELTDVGYQPRNLLVATPVLRIPPGEDPSGDKPDPQGEERRAERSQRFYQELFVRLRALRGAQAVAITDALPLREPAERPNWSVVSQDEFLRGNRNGPSAERASVSPGYFAAIGMMLLGGRDFDDRDTTVSQKVVVVSAALAQRLWPEREAIGRTLTVLSEWERNATLDWYAVVGVVSDVSPILHERATRPFVYFPLGQQWRPSSAFVVVRGSGDSRTLIPAVKDAVARADLRADVARVETMRQMIGNILYPRRIAAAVLGTSALTAMLLAMLGVYGVVSYSVAQRTGEIGVRIALGAERSDIIRLVLREAGTVATLGSLAGLLLGYAAIRVTSSRYLAIPHVDIATLVTAPVLISTVVLLACYIPALRATRLNALDVLRRV